ncbi:putative uridine nucleosidase 2 [Morella rubra]|uniref:Inosine nucleosidase n=1 Tax=Morella rubra TaxID=262757 RepID=A0A6A1W1I1_9ROSI|nr:putative uridine nucleosidase 2 [Morella rubra]
MAAQPKKIIIDTDPGIDDTMAIFVALRSPEVEHADGHFLIDHPVEVTHWTVGMFNDPLPKCDPPSFISLLFGDRYDDTMAIFVALRSPEVEVIGLTTIYGNVYTTLATRNALHLLEVAGRTDIPVAEGSHVTITKGTKLRIADFVHGKDGLGNQNFPPPKGKPSEQSAATFLIEQANLYPGKVTVVALGPLTNIALAIQQDPAFLKNIGQIVVLGGSFSVNGNVNPAAEANILGDPDAADIVFTSGADVLAVGLNVTHQVVLTDADREKLARSDGKFAQYLCKILEVYFSYHRDAYLTKGVYLHDPTALLAAVDPSLFTCTEGVVRVQTCGITRGLTILYNKQKRFGEVTEWTDKPSIKVAVTVDAPAVVKLVMERLMDS